jgi:hypothetical protein
MTDDNPPALDVGDYVEDRDGSIDATMVVVGTPLKRAGRTIVDGTQTLADYNPEYPAEDHVIEAVIPRESCVNIATTKRYSFPRSRLERRAQIHDHDGEGKQ